MSVGGSLSVRLYTFPNLSLKFGTALLVVVYLLSIASPHILGGEFFPGRPQKILRNIVLCVFVELTMHFC